SRPAWPILPFALLQGKINAKRLFYPLDGQGDARAQPVPARYGQFYLSLGIKKPHALCQRRLSCDCMIGLANTTHSIPNRARKEKTIFDEFCVFSRRLADA
ncbi:hypothetical protein, partial [Anaerotruncus colihominis]|uniref:hypothetical protein n=1 Tax=Anaerotruncus colihominis TaxID=169435 RepID=UPI0024301CA8